jgi:hypothetical protein
MNYFISLKALTQLNILLTKPFKPWQEIEKTKQEYVL